MNFKKYQPLFEVTLLAILVFFVHKIVFFLSKNNPYIQDFHFSIEAVYGFFFFCSLLIILTIIIVNEKNIDNVGFTFVLVTFIKMALSYTILSPILNSGHLNIRTEKINFFIIFALFLTIETIITVRILNKKQ